MLRAPGKLSKYFARLVYDPIVKPELERVLTHCNHEFVDVTCENNLLDLLPGRDVELILHITMSSSVMWRRCGAEVVFWMGAEGTQLCIK